MAGRSGEPLHIALLSVASEREAALPRHSLDRCMDNLQGIILSHLRQGDAAARCSASQFVLLLPQATYENGRQICERIIRAFGRQFPHSPAVLRASVQSLMV
jgi:GGDEF domain-containing protein